MYLLEEFVNEAGEFKMTPPMKTAVLVGGLAAAAGLAFAFWPKKAHAEPVAGGSIGPSLHQQWVAAANFKPGSYYTVIAPVPVDPRGAAMLDRQSAAALLASPNWISGATAGWSNGQIVYYPSDASMPQIAGIPITSIPAGSYIFQGQYNGSVTAFVPTGMTAYELVSG